MRKVWCVCVSFSLFFTFLSWEKHAPCGETLSQKRHSSPIPLWLYMSYGAGASPLPATPLFPSDALLWRETCDLDDDCTCSDGCTLVAGEPSATWLQQPIGMPAPAGSNAQREPTGAAPGGGGVISRRRASPSPPPGALPVDSRKLPSRRDCWDCCCSSRRCAFTWLGGGLGVWVRARVRVRVRVRGQWSVVRGQGQGQG